MSKIKEYDINKIYIGNIILQMIDFKITGWLELVIKDVTKKLYMKEGEFVYANSTENNDKIGMVLVNSGKISFKQLLDALEYQKHSKKMLGAVLIELSYVKITDLEYALYQQAKQIIMSLFNYSTGIVRCYYGDIPKEVIPLKLNTEQIVIDSIKKINDIELLIKALGDLDLVFELNLVPSKIQSLSLENKDLIFLKKISGRKITIKEVENLYGAPRIEIYRLLYLLMATGCLKVADSASKYT
jgi:hypothetical protein